MAVAAVCSGCADDTPPPPRAAIPPVGTYTTPPPVPPKPLPTNDPMLANMPPFQDAPLVSQPTPEQGAFVAMYERVGRPRIMVFANRTLAGRIVPTSESRVTSIVERTRTATGAVKTEVDSSQLDPWGRPISGQHDKFETNGPAEVRDRTETRVPAAGIDEVSARRIDYDAIESVLADGLSGGGRVTLVSPKLTEGQTRKLQAGDTNALADLSRDSDVLIQVQARPSVQTGAGTSVRLIAEAMNTRGGESLGRAFVDVPPPLEKQTINEFTRYLARKLMSDMTQTWANPRPAAEAPPQPMQPVPQTAPSLQPQQPMIEPPASQPNS